MHVAWAACSLAMVGAVQAVAPAPFAPKPTATPTRSFKARADDNSGSSDDNAHLPAGGLSITEPPQTAQASYYKIAPHETITFGWEFTSLKKTPSKLYVVASCSKNGNTYPIAPSPTGIPGDAKNVTWYPYGYHLDAQSHGDPDLVADKYRLVIYDDKGPDGVPKGGEFLTNNMLEFSMYFPRKYTPLSEWSCPSCSGAAPARPSVPATPAMLSSLAVLACGAALTFVCL